MLDKIIRHLPEGIALLIIIMGISTIISKAAIALQTNPDYKPDYLGAVVYIGVAFVAFAILKAVQLISEELFSKKDKN